MKRASRIVVIGVACWCAVAAVFAIQAASRAAWAEPFGHTLWLAIWMFVPYMLLTPAVIALALRFRFTAPEQVESAVAHGIGLTLFAVATGALMGVLLWIVTAPTDISLGALAAKSVFQYIAIDMVMYLLIVTIVLAWAGVRDARARAMKAVELQGQLAQARVHLLSAQLHPHFLFNTLNAIAALVRDDPPKAERLVLRLGELLRRTLADGALSETSLEQELQFLEEYLEIQETRYGPRLQVAFDIDADVLATPVPRMLLQPLIENAIQHGIAPRVGPGSIVVSAHREHERLRLSVLDDGVGLPLDGVKEGIGLRTTRARLQALYGDDVRLGVTTASPTGTECVILLPMHPAAAQAS